jgi:hypothetical protein
VAASAARAAAPSSDAPSAPDVVLSDLGGLSGAFGALAAACQAVYVDLGVDPAAASALPIVRTVDGADAITPADEVGQQNGHN